MANLGVGAFLRRAIAAITGARRDRELGEEIEGHIEMRRLRLIEDGVDPHQAAREARRMFGNVAAIREETRDLRGFPAIGMLMQDLRYGARLLRRSRAFTLTAVVSLAFGIGASTAVFSLASTLFRKLPVARPDELVLLRWVNTGDVPFQSLEGRASRVGDDNTSATFALAAFEAVRSDAADLVDAFALADLYQVNVSAEGQPAIENAQVVSGNYFSALGVAAAAGRTIADPDLAPGAPPVAVLSYDYWQRRFGGSRDALGSTIVVNNLHFSVIGVSPQDFEGTLQPGRRPAVTLPLSAYQPLTRGGDVRDPNRWWVLIMARLRPGVTPETARSRVDAVVKQTVRWARPALATAQLPRVVLDPGAAGQTDDRDSMREPIGAMAFVVGIVLVTACANVATLLLARGRARRAEIAIRVGIGASRRRIVRQLMTESVLLATIGSVAGLALAMWMTAALGPVLTSRAPAGSELSFRLDWTVVGFTTLLAFACSIGFGLVPALRSTDVHLGPGLQEGTRGGMAARRSHRLGSMLVVVQVSLSMLLLSVAGLLAASVRNLEAVAPGFDPHGVLVFGIDPRPNGYDEAKTRQILDAALARLRALPGVEAASISSQRLIANASPSGAAWRLDQSRPAPGSAGAGPFGTFMRTHRAWPLVVDETFLSTMRIPILRGRGLAASDTKEAATAAVVNEALARRLFGTTDVVGRQFRSASHGDVPVQIVGVAGNARYTSMRFSPPPTMYVSYRQRPMAAATFAVRTSGDAAALAPAVREAVRQIDPTLPLVNLVSQDDQIRTSLTEERRFAALAVLLGGVALLLSAIGVHGLLAHAVSGRTREIGVRMALGAAHPTVRWMVLRQSLALTGAGLALGIPSALAGGRLVQSMLYGLTPTDPATVATAAAALAASALIAAWVPARRASRVDPIVALRAD